MVQSEDPAEEKKEEWGGREREIDELATIIRTPNEI